MVQTLEQKKTGLARILNEEQRDLVIPVRKPLMPKRQPRRRSNPRRQAS
jgi:hypothetical protein